MSFSLIDDALLRTVLDRAGEADRRRTNHNFHDGPADNPHRFLNAMRADTYVQPHRHRAPPKSESFVVLTGQVVVFLFDDEGRPTHRHDLGAAPLPRGIDLKPGVWHTIFAVSDEAVVFEVKPGPWDATTDKELAPWAPAENDPAAADYRAQLMARTDLS